MSDDFQRVMAGLASRMLRTRWLVRAPITVYRIGLGFVFGSRLLLLEHVGRRSGARRFVVLEVLEHATATEYVVVSGFGLRAQWYRNVLAEPAVRVSSGFRRGVAATAVPLEPAEAAAVLRRYAEARPRTWANLKSTLEATLGHTVHELPMVLLRLTGG